MIFFRILPTVELDIFIPFFAKVLVMAIFPTLGLISFSFLIVSTSALVYLGDLTDFGLLLDLLSSRDRRFEESNLFFQR